MDDLTGVRYKFIWIDSRAEERFELMDHGLIFFEGMIQPRSLVVFEMGKTMWDTNHYYEIRMLNRDCEPFEVIGGCHMKED